MTIVEWLWICAVIILAIVLLILDKARRSRT
jgi:hypothetical protein